MSGQTIGHTIFSGTKYEHVSRMHKMQKQCGQPIAQFIFYRPVFDQTIRKKISQSSRQLLKSMKVGNKVLCFVKPTMIIYDLHNIRFLTETRQANQGTRPSSFRRHEKNVIALDHIIPCQYLLQKCNMNP